MKLPVWLSSANKNVFFQKWKTGSSCLGLDTSWMWEEAGKM
jgi:hypothetical protein